MLQHLGILSDMDTVYEPVVDLDGKTERLSSVLLRILSPRDPGNVVVKRLERRKIPFVRQRGQVDPGQAGVVDQRIRFLLPVDEPFLLPALLQRLFTEHFDILIASSAESERSSM